MNAPLPAPPRTVLHAVAPPREPEIHIEVSETVGGWCWDARNPTGGFEASGSAVCADLAALEALHVTVSAHLDVHRLVITLIGGKELDAAARFAAEHLRRVKVSRRTVAENNAEDQRAIAMAKSVRGAVEIATDASMPSGVSFGRAAWAWVAADGRFRTGLSEQVTIAGAELWAIASAARDHRFAASVRILSDSQDAVRVARLILAGEPVPRHFAGVSTSRVNGASRRLNACQGAVTVEWVRGHSGHDLNEAADRLAKRARWAAVHQQSPLVRTA